MKLVHPDMERQIVFQGYMTSEWIIESPLLFSKYVQELYWQTEGEDGNFALSEGEKEFDIAKCMELVIDPLGVNINEKKIITKLYSELEELAYGETMFLQTQEMSRCLQQYLGDLEQTSPYMLSISENIEIATLFKSLNVKLESYAENLFENLNQYIRVQAELLKKKIIVFINLRSYVGDEQLELLIKNAMYNEISLLFIESEQKNFLKETTRYIIDFDGCEI